MPLVLLHGFAQQAHSWDFTALCFRDRFRVLALDFRGHGDSAWSPDGVYSYERNLADLEAFVQTQAPGPFVLCGLSMGGHLACAYTARHADMVHALVVVEAAPESRGAGTEAVRRFVSGPTEFDSLDELVARVAEYSPHRPLERIRGALTHYVRRLPGGRWAWKYDPRIRDRRGPWPSPDDRWAVLSAIRCPTLFITGSESEVIAASTIERMLEAVPGSESASVPLAGHRVPGDNPAAFHAVMRGFLDRRLKGHGASRGQPQSGGS